MFSRVTTIFGAFFSGVLPPALALPLRLPLLFLPFLFSSPGRRIPMVFLGRSITWPKEAFTVYFRPRYLLIVLALAGDSTITSDRAMFPFVSRKYLRDSSHCPPRSGRY